MPRVPLHALIWSSDQSLYELYTQDQLEQRFRPADEAAWLAWLREVTSFAFHGASGSLNVYLEGRPRGGQYWYAYHTVRDRTRKRYLGPLTRVTFARLEEAAHRLTSLPPSPLAQTSIAPSPEQQGELLTTKLTAPRLPTWLVERSRLLRELDGVCAHRLTLVSASAGSGKTTLLSAWAAAQGAVASRREEAGHRVVQRAFAWLSLDALDTEPTRFWTSVIAALRTGLPNRGQTAFALLHSQEAPPLSTILTALLYELEQMGTDIILILDDYHVISDQAIHDSILFLLDHLPANLHLVLATRKDPELPLSRFRVRGQLLEIRDQDLRFSRAETTSFLLQGMGLPLSEEEVAILETRTEGWVAGLQLAALSLRKREDLSAFVRDFAGSHRYLFDYVQQDILAQLPAPLLDFLLQTAILPRMNAAICQAVTASPSLQASQQMLLDVERANLFVVPLDEQRQWYRYHDLFREALQVRLQASHPGLVPLLHQRAASFYEAADELREAIAHALAAGDFSYAARMMEREAPHLWLSGEAQTVYTWMVALPDAVLWQHASLALNAMLRLLQALYQTTEVSYGKMQAWVEQTIGRLEAILRREAQPGGGLEGEQTAEAELVVIRRRLRLLRALIETRAILRRGDKKRLSLLAQELEGLGQDEEISWNIISLAIAFWLTESFQREEAPVIKRLLEAKQQARKTGDWFASIRVMTWLPFVYLKAGALHQLERECLEALALVEQSDRRTAWAGYLHLLLSYAYYAWNRLDEAAGSIQQTLRIAQDWQQVDLLISGNLLVAQLELIRRDLVATDQALQQAEILIQQERFASRAFPVAAARVQYWLIAGDLDAARRWAEQAVFSPEAWDRYHKGAVLMRVRVYLTQQQYTQALEVLDCWSRQLDRPSDIQTTINVLALHLVALHQAGKREQSRAVAARLLSLTEPEGHLRVYLDLGEPMKQALKALLSVPPNAQPDAASASFSRTYLLRLLAIFEQEESTAAKQTPRSGPSEALTQEILPPQAEGQLLSVEPLSPQELKVLRLLVAGRTYAEMAQTLVVSIHTIKTQVSSIYRKLGVSRRAEAIAATQQLHLL
jgi:LuxR family maltose regulon positive regulatory protein